MTGTDLVPYATPPRPWRIVMLDEYAIARPHATFGRRFAEILLAADNERRAEAAARWRLMFSARDMADMVAALDTDTEGTP